MGAAPYLRNNAYQISDMYRTSSLHVHRYKNNGKAHQSTSKLRAKGCSLRKMKGVLFHSSLGTKPTPTDLLTWCKNKCLALGKSIWRIAQTPSQIHVLQTCSLGLCGRLPLSLPQLNSASAVCSCDYSPPTHSSASIMEKAGIWQLYLMEWMDHQTITDDWEPSRLQSSENTKPRFQLTATP